MSCCKRVAAVVIGGAALMACSDDGDAANDADGSETATGTADADQSTTTAITTTTHPPASDGTAFVIIEDLVAEAGDIQDRLFANPSLVNDPSHPDVVRLEEIYTDDSPDLDAILDQLETLADAGHNVEPGQSGVLSEEVAYSPTVVDDETIEFRFCAIYDNETVDDDGDVISSGAMAAMADGEARRIDGVWRFHGVSPDPDFPRELDPSDVPEEFRFCEEIFADQQGDTG